MPETEKQMMDWIEQEGGSLLYSHVITGLDEQKRRELDCANEYRVFACPTTCGGIIIFASYKEGEWVISPPSSKMLVMELVYLVSKLKAERLQLAKLAADTPQFCNPLVVYDAKKLRDRILKGGE